ncbi:MAG: asparagine synthase (glutamine-hydrolyzing) [Marinibacterium sp.]|nr:asparagine synthase (glutamine-hydrolyzing) [Marinibacterium sp.]
MCGLSGLFQIGQTERDLAISVRRMSDALRHRGPDDAGIWVDQDAGIALSHRRLAILDLSAEGHQPMVSESGRFVLCYNGEIYNHLDLRDHLTRAGHAPAWRGHSDTETLLAAIEAWGVEDALQRASGMFAFALWDRCDQALVLARDRFGEKPLYYGWCGGHFAFGSELAPLRSVPGFDNPVSRAALAQYLRVMYVPAPFSIYEGIFKLEPGCLLRVGAGSVPCAPTAPPRARDAAQDGLSLHRWWSFSDEVAAGARDPVADPEAAQAMLYSRLRAAVDRQSLADVPLGAFLSGGVDSSLIVALMQDCSTRAVRTFTIGFEDASYDESPHAAAVAAHLGTVHTAMTVTAEDARLVIPNLARIYDEPFADSSQVPTYLLCGAARRDVTVALSGDAGDEIFGGYNRYLWAPRIWNNVKWLPGPLRQAIAKGVTAVPPSAWDRFGKLMGQRERSVARLGEKMHKLGSRLERAQTLDAFHLNLASQWLSPGSLVNGLGAEEGGMPLAMHDPIPDEIANDDVARMMFRDTLTYLPDDILCKVDRAAMAVSLETRVPFLDVEVVRTACRLPMSMKTCGGTGKIALRRLLDDYVPKELIERPKSGFAMPIGQWLRGPLRDWAEDLLAPERLEREGYLDPEAVCAAWEEHKLGREDRTAQVWSVLMFQSWLDGLAQDEVSVGTDKVTGL